MIDLRRFVFRQGAPLTPKQDNHFERERRRYGDLGFAEKPHTFNDNGIGEYIAKMLIAYIAVKFE